ncbi:MAG: SPW repeat protein [Firmicutes bacterium]|nr:SPW repeat protein [Alicyclobacillaceae bacterium]MCL6496553.1 SPW repeat protein [Bacillota bacterium]
MMTRNGILAIFGAWFVVSAWVLNPMQSQAYLWTAVILGGLTLIGAVWAMIERKHRAWRAYLMALFGLYLGLTPFFYNFAVFAGALWVTMLVGAATVASGLWDALAHDTGASPDHPAHHVA